jgi:hypothetical protein
MLELFMQIIFFAKRKNILELAAQLPMEKIVFWFGEDPSAIDLEAGGVVFVDYDDPDFQMSSFESDYFSLWGQSADMKIVLLSGELNTKEFKSLQKEHKTLDSFIRTPIKLKDIESFVEDYLLVQNELRESMEGAKKKDFEDPINAKIQHRFDLVFSGPSSKQAHTDESRSTVFNHGTDIDADEIDFNLGGDTSMGSSTKKNQNEKSSVVLDLDFDANSELDFETTTATTATKTTPAPATSAKASNSESTSKLSVVPNDNDLDFTLDFGNDDDSLEMKDKNSGENSEDAPLESKVDELRTISDIDANEEFIADFSGTEETEDAEVAAESVAAADAEAEAEAEAEKTKSDSHFELDLSDDNLNGNDAAKDLDNLFGAELEAASRATTLPDGTQKTILFNSKELVADLESFKGEKTELKMGSTADHMTTEEAKANIESTIKDILRPKVLEGGIKEFDMDALNEPAHHADFKNDTSGTAEFNLNEMDFTDDNEIRRRQSASTSASKKASVDNYQNATAPLERGHASYVSDEESTRFHAVIRQLREEREELLGQIKSLKSDVREVEQDNLTLKAALDETKIEVTLLRKRHLAEMEDMKYRLTINEEKRAMAEEKARSAESKREKLEQRVRIDFNQIKQREKELETKLEMVSIDVDSQVHSRDQKILELRRKIDSLEFNMENVSIKEQKSEKDKRNLEDKLNKIMKTLRHSIKNLEDDIDQVNEDSQDVLDNESEHKKIDHRSKA